MIKRQTCLVIAALLVVCCMQGALADSFSFPYAGIRLDAPAEWTVLTPDTLEAHESMLAQLGADMKTLQADYAANHTVLEAYLPEGIQVSLSAVQTEQTAQWDSVARMSEADRDAFLEAFSQPPYENAAWSETMPGYLQCSWSLEAGGIPVSFAGLMTVRQGMLYMFTASGASVTAEALQEANAAVLARVYFQGTGTAPVTVETATAVVITPVTDDGKNTPIELLDFEGVTYEDTSVLKVRTLPNTEIILRTATDSLRGRADEEGLQQFQVSTKRESVYTYTIWAQAEGRGASELDVALERQLTPEAQEAAYRRSARQIDVYGYSNLVGAPEAYGGKPVTFRGRVGDFAEIGGFPCVLIYTENPGRGVWRSPMWVLMTEAVELNVDDIRTVYGDIRGDTMPYKTEDGEELQAPVVVSHSIQN